jgi:hypothetical protein
MKSNPKPRRLRPKLNRPRDRAQRDEPDESPNTNAEPLDPPTDPEEPTDLDVNSNAIDDIHWNVFLFDDEYDRDPLPDSGDFWLPD